MQPRQCDRIAPVGLDPLARPLRDQRWSDHQAGVTESLDLAIEPISGRSRLITEMQLAVAARQLAHQPLHCRRQTRHLAEKAHLPAAPAIGNRHHVLRLRRVECDKSFAILPMVRPPCMRLGSARPILLI
jgi:hypothetical protein